MQPSLKETLDSYLVAQTLTNAVGAVGAIFAAVAAPLGAVIAAIVAKEGLEAVKEKFGDIMEDVTAPAAEKIVEPYTEGWAYYQAVGRAIMNGQFPREAPIYALANPQGWQAFLQEVNGGSEFSYGPKMVFDNLKGMYMHIHSVTVKFLQDNPGVNANSLPQEWNIQVFNLMKSYYPTNQLKDDIVNDFKSNMEKLTWSWGPAGWVIQKSLLS